MANTIDDLKEQALTIKNASQTGENTANRVGTLFYDIVDNLVVGKYEFRYKNSKVKPTKPADGSDGTTGGWAKEPTDPLYEEGELTWMTQCYYSYVNGYGKWSTPIRITGANGKDGEDGKDVEFIYTRNDTGKELRAPIYDARGNEVATQDDWYGTDSLGVSWTDNPQGVEEDVRYEYICVRTKEAGAARWGAFSEPVIWSKWGEKGKDGDGYEYIFINTSDESIIPNINYDTWFDPRTQTYKTKNDDEYLPYSSNGTYTTRWNDDPSGVSITSRIEWVSVRKKIKGAWGDFSDPKVWSRYAEDGAAGGRYEIRYKNYIPTEEAPVPAKPTEDGRSDGWTDNPVDPDIERGEYTFLSQAYYNEGKEESTGTYGEWSDPIRITGPQGEQGEDGADIEFIYTRINDLINAPAAPIYDADHNPINTQDDWKGTDDAGVVWTDNPQGIDPDDHRYEFVSMRSKIVSQSIWGPFCTPVVWSNWGDKGMDGDGIQYIFKLFDHELDDDERVSNVPTNATLNSKGEWMPSGTSGVNAGWHDNPPSATQNMPFCYCSTIKKIGGEWNKEGDYGKFETLGYWTKWSADGSNAVRVDLDNEMDSILYDGTGTQKMSGNVSTKAYVYDGITDVSDQAAFSISSREGVSEEQAVISGRTITVNGLTSDGIVTVRAEYPKNSGKYYFSTFTVKKLVGVDKYELVVIPNAVSVNRSETVTDRTISVQVYRTPANGGAREVINVNSYGLTLTATASNGVVLEGQGATTITYNLPGTLADSVDYVTVLLTKVTVVQDVETIPVTHVKNGKDGSGANAVKIDLDNEMDAIPCDVDGYVMAETNLQTGARIYDGANPVVLTEGNTEVTIEKIAGVAASYTFNDGVVNISWVIRTSITPLAQDKYTAKVTLKWHDNYYYGTFTASVVRSGEPGVSPIIYQLAPDPNTIAFKRDSSGNLPTSPVTLKMLMKKNDADGTHYINIDQSGLTVRYDFTKMPDEPGAGNPFPNSGIPVPKEKNNVYVAAFSGNYLMDRETVPIVVDGENGTSPWIADLDNEMDSVACDINGKPVIKSSPQTNLSMFYGSSKKKFKIVGVTCNGGSATRTGVSVTSYPEGFAESISVTVEYTTQATIGKDDFAITMQPEDAPAETRILHFTVNGVKPGPDGKPASIYRLVPSCSEIARKSDGSTVPSTDITCKVIKTTGNSTPEEVTPSSELILRTFVNGKESSSTVNPRSVTTNIEYILSYNSVVVDRETIPLVVDGNEGPQGPGGWSVTANPSTATITQGMGTNTKTFSQVEVTFSLKKGNTDVNVFDIDTPYSKEFIVSKDNNHKSVLVKEPNLDSTGQYYTEGSFTVTVYAKDPDDTTKTVSFTGVKVPCVANLLGTWKEWVDGGTKNIVADSFKYVDGESTTDPTGKLGTVRDSYRRTATAAGNYETWSSDESTKEGSLKWINQHINTADQNISTITKQVSGDNLFIGLDKSGSNCGWFSRAFGNSISYYPSLGLLQTSTGSPYEMISPLVYLVVGRVYCISAYLVQNSFFRANNIKLYKSDRTEYTSTSIKTVEDNKTTGETMSYDQVTWTRRYIRLKVDNTGWYHISFYQINGLLYPQFEFSGYPTKFNVGGTTTQSMIKQTADEIDQTITNKLGETGININGNTREINLIAGKVSFRNSMDTDVNPYFSVDKNGKMYAQGGGSIGGFEIADNSIGEDRSSSGDENFTTIYNDGKAFFCNYTTFNSSFVVHGNTEIIGNSISLDGNVFLNAASGSQKVYIDGQLNMKGTFDNNKAGDVYRDNFGSLFVRGFDNKSNYNQINFKTSGTNLLLPSNVPPATVYFAKLEGNGIVTSFTPIMNSHNRELWSKPSGYYMANIYQESHFFVFDGTYWIDYFCSFQ